VGRRRRQGPKVGGGSIVEEAGKVSSRSRLPARLGMRRQCALKMRMKR
jgi:hypothetical protein